MTEPTKAPRTFGDVIALYLRSTEYDGLAASTRDGYLRYLTRAQDPELLGKVPLDAIRPALVQRFLNGLAHTPGAQKYTQVALKAVERWALVLDLLPRDITKGTKAGAPGGGRMPWTPEQVRLAILHARPHISRAVALAAATGQRESDLVKMRWSDLRTAEGTLGVDVVQQKTKVRLWIPFDREFTTVLNTWERAPTFLLLRDDGRRWTAHELSVAWGRERDRIPELAPLKGCVLHGLRATRAIELRRAGASHVQICAILGMSRGTVERYTRYADQETDALAALRTLEGPSNVVPFGKKEGA